jgi:predicted RecB family nuclease
MGAATETDLDEIKAEILTYNEDDVRATEAMVSWLRRIANEA